VFNKNGLIVKFGYNMNPASPQSIAVHAEFTNRNPANFENFDFQVAVPRYLKLQFDSASSKSVPANGGSSTQRFTLENSMHGQKPILIRARINYTFNGNTVVEQAQFDQFPAS